MNKQNVLSLLVIALGAVTFWASVTQKQVALKTPSYSWTPPTTEPIPNKFTFALIHPHYADNSWELYDPFRTFSQSLAGDTEELLTARGYSIRGPFKTRDEMVYADKEVCDLALIIEVDPTFKFVEGGFSVIGQCKDGSTGYGIKDGVLAIYGKINLVALEPLTGEKLWVKSVEIPEQRTEKINVKTGYCNATFLTFITKQNAVQNAVIDLLQAGYTGILDKMWNHLEPSEFERLKPTIEQLKKSK